MLSFTVTNTINSKDTKYKVKVKEIVRLHIIYLSSPSASSSDLPSISSSLSPDFTYSSLVSSGQALPFPFCSLWLAILFISQVNRSILPPSHASFLVLQFMATITSPSHRSRTCVIGSGYIDGPTTKNPPNASLISSVLTASATAVLVLLRFSPPHSNIATTVANVSLSLHFSPLADLFIIAINTSK